MATAGDGGVARGGALGLVAVALLLVVACAETETTTDDPARGDRVTETDEPEPTPERRGQPDAPDDPLPRVVTTDTPDGRYAMTVGASATLELPQGTSPPTVQGEAIELIDVAWFADPGVATWEIRALQAGESTIVATVDDAEHVWTIRVPD